jgi:hypothetical protein
VLWYDSSFVTTGEYLGQLDGCRIAPMIQPAAAITQGEYPLEADSGFIVTRVLQSGQTVPHPDAQRLFDAFYFAIDSIVPVFVLPRLIEQQADLSYAWRQVPALVIPSGPLSPAIWFDSRRFKYEVENFPADLRPYSTLAHEMTHVLVAPLSLSGTVVWGDNSTPFLHIQTHRGTFKKQRLNQTTGPGSTSSVQANDVNRRYLIRNGLEDACTSARFNTRYVRPVFP